MRCALASASCAEHQGERAAGSQPHGNHEDERRQIEALAAQPERGQQQHGRNRSGVRSPDCVDGRDVLGARFGGRAILRCIDANGIALRRNRRQRFPRDRSAQGLKGCGGQGVPCALLPLDRLGRQGRARAVQQPAGQDEERQDRRHAPVAPSDQCGSSGDQRRRPHEIHERAGEKEPDILDVVEQLSRKRSRAPLREETHRQRADLGGQPGAKISRCDHRCVARGLTSPDEQRKTDDRRRDCQEDDLRDGQACEIVVVIKHRRDFI